jgi:hypothetical protein
MKDNMDLDDYTEFEKDIPISNCVSVIPKSMPELKDHIHNMLWNCVDNTITLDIGEDPHFNAFTWIYNINITRAALLKSAFGDREKEQVTVEFCNRSDQPLAKITLIGLELLSHICVTGRGCYQPVTHTVIIKYEKMLPWKYEKIGKHVE